MRALLCVPLAMMIVGAMFGCSGNNGPASAPTAPDIQEEGIRVAGGESHYCLGLWQMVADPVAGKLDVIEMRDAAFHLNALPFLEPPLLVNLSLEYLKFVGTDEVIADIGLRHPFLGLTEFTGFDVCGVFISNGTSTFGETGLTYAAGDDTHLLNPDGLTRWWNPDDFPQDGTIFNYKDGLLGTPDSMANFSTDLNPYKYYTDELTAEDDILICTPAKRGQFSAGQKNIRRFDIYLGTQGLVFNYAVDASWEFPQGPKPWTAPDDFGENANRPEAWAIRTTELKNTLWNDGNGSGGNLSLSVDVYDHFKVDLNTVRVQSPGNFSGASTATPVGSGDGYSTYQIDITGATPAAGSIPLYYIIECEQEGYGGKIPGAPISAYFMGSANVSANPDTITVLIPDGGEEWEVNTEHEITWEHTGNVGPVKIEYSKDGFSSDVHEIVPSTPNDGSYTWLVPIDPSDTVRIRISDAAVPTIYDISDDDFSIILPACVIHVDDDNIYGPWDGSEENPYKLLQDGVNGAVDDCLIWVHPGTYNEVDQVTVSGFTNLTIHGEDLPVIHPPFNLSTGKAAIHVFSSPSCIIDDLELLHSYAYQSALWLENSTDCSVQNCLITETWDYGFNEFVRANGCPNLTIRNNCCDGFNTSSTYGSIIVLIDCNDSAITLNTCRNYNKNTGSNMYQTAEGYIICWNCSNVEVSKNIFGYHHRACDSSNYVALWCIEFYYGSGNIVRNNLIYDVSFYDASAGVTASYNIGVYANQSQNLEIYNNTFDRIGINDPGAGATYAVELEGCNNPALYNNIFSNLIAPQSGDCYGVYSDTSVAQTYSDVWNLVGLNTYRYAGSATEGTGGINDDPMFTDPDNEDYTLLPGSPCAGTGLDGDDMGCHGGDDPLP